MLMETEDFPFLSKMKFGNNGLVMDRPSQQTLTSFPLTEEMEVMVQMVEMPTTAAKEKAMATKEKAMATKEKATVTKEKATATVTAKEKEMVVVTGHLRNLNYLMESDRMLRTL